jgi:hypothetical protein
VTSAPPTAQLRAVLEPALGARITAFERRPSEYRTSFPLEEIDVRLGDGRRLALMFKDVARESLDPKAIAVKPELLADPLREIEVYERVLSGAGVGTPKCHATRVDPGAGRYWLFIERVPGVELYQVGRRSTWEYVAARLAGMHQALAPRASRSARLVRYDLDLLMTWPRRAAEFAQGDVRLELERIASGYERVAKRLLALPTGVIHNEFYASNVLVDDPDEPRRVCPVDWEVAAVGPLLIDLAALVSGRWTPDDRRTIANAYRSALPPSVRPSEAELAQGLDACRLHLALQWLGWSPDWTPPPEHATDWLGAASELAGAVGL